MKLYKLTRFVWIGMAMLSMSACFPAWILGTEIVRLEVPVWAEGDVYSFREPLFFSSGVPLAEGSVASEKHLKVLDANGNEVPAQFTPLAFWPGGSLKWVGISPVLSAGTTLPLSLHHGQPNDSLQQVMAIQKVANGVQVETDLLTMEIATNGAGFAITQKRTGRRMMVDWELQRLTRPAQRTTEAWLGSRESVEGLPRDLFSIGHSSADQVVVEEQGPVRTVVRVSGYFTSATGESFCRYDYRLYLYQGSETVRWQPTWIYTGHPESEIIGGLEAILSASGEPVRHATVRYSEESEDPRATRQITEQRVLPGHAVVQEMLEFYLDGWLSWETESDINLPIQVAVREFWQNYPSGFEVNEDMVRVGFWPSASVSYLDLARTSGGDGDGESGTDMESHATGVGKTFEVLIHPGVDSDHFKELATVFEQEPLFYPGSEYMVQTGVLGPIAAEDRIGFPRIEGLYRALVFWILENRKKFEWYGFIDYGDVRTNFLRSEQSWRTQGRYGWRQGSGDVPSAIFTHYFRTGDRVAWTLGAPYARHVLDVDTVHYEHPGTLQPKGPMHRRGQDHWSGKIQTQYTYTQGAFLYHYLSGDLRARSVLLEETAPWQSAPEQAWSANAFNTMIRAWEATGDSKWRELARQQLQPHLGGDSYDNFRFAVDFIPALSQYVWLTGEEEATEELRQRGRTFLDPEKWAYFHPSIGRRGGRYMVPAMLYNLDGDATATVRYPARTLAQMLPQPVPPELDWNWETLTTWLGRVPPHGITATTLTAEIGEGPYFIRAMQECGWTEESIQTLPEVYGTRNGALIGGTYSDLGQKLTDYGNPWQMLSLPALPIKDREGHQYLLQRLQGLPFGAVLYVNRIPFHIPRVEENGGWVRMEKGDQVQIEVPDDATALHLLGPMIEKGDWREGVEVIEYTLHLKDGTKRNGIWRNLIDLDDYRGFHYAVNSPTGRFWQLGKQARTHLDVITLDFGGAEVQSVELRDMGQGYTTFILAVTAQLKGKETGLPVTEIVFGGEPQAGRHVLNAQRAAGEPGQAKWNIGDSHLSRLRFQDNRVIAENALAFQVPVHSGDYLVEFNIRNTHVLGGAIEVRVSGNRIDAFSLAGREGDKIAVPAKVTDGLLRIEIQTSRALLSSVNQKPDFELESVRIWTLPAGEWRLNRGEEIVMLQGNPLIDHATLKQSVGAESLYSFYNMQQLKEGGKEYRVDRASWPQDIIFSFEEKVEIHGVSFSAFSGYGPRRVILEVREDSQSDWKKVEEWDLNREYPAIRQNISPQNVKEARFVMPSGYDRTLRILEVDFYGSR